MKKERKYIMKFLENLPAICILPFYFMDEKII